MSSETLIYDSCIEIDQEILDIAQDKKKLTRLRILPTEQNRRLVENDGRGVVLLWRDPKYIMREYRAHDQDMTYCDPFLDIQKITDHPDTQPTVESFAEWKELPNVITIDYTKMVRRTLAVVNDVLDFWQYPYVEHAILPRQNYRKKRWTENA